MIKTFYVIHDSDYMTGEYYTYHTITMDTDTEEINETTILKKLNDKYKYEGCNINKWDQYNTFYEIYEDCSETEPVDDGYNSLIYELTDEPNEKFLNMLSLMEDEEYKLDDEYRVEEQIEIITRYYTRYGCTQDENAINRAEY